jgi:hypothetical protein
MRAIAMTTFITLLAANVFAQQPQADQATTAQIRRGTHKIELGVGLAIVGAVLMVVPTNGKRSDDHRLDAPAAAMVAGGFGLILWGTKDRTQAIHPQTTFGLMVGRSQGVQIRRVW